MSTSCPQESAAGTAAGTAGAETAAVARVIMPAIPAVAVAVVLTMDVIAILQRNQLKLRKTSAQHAPASEAVDHVHHREN